MAPNACRCARDRRQVRDFRGAIGKSGTALNLQQPKAVPFFSVGTVPGTGSRGRGGSGCVLARTPPAHTTNFALGFPEASSIFATFPATFSGETIDSTAVLIAFTRYGDADLNSVVNLDDFNRLAVNFGQSNRVWSQGDFDYNTMVNLDDFNKLAANFGLSASPAGPSPEDWSALASVVPEPNSLVFAATAASAAALRRRGWVGIRKVKPSGRI